MKIKEATSKHILFDNGNEITTDYFAECCEWNYADFEQLDDLALAHDFKGKLHFEEVDGAGFRFGDDRRMFFVPCYSVQNGYYSSYIYVYYNGEEVLGVDAEFVYG